VIEALTPLAFWVSCQFPLRWPLVGRHFGWHVVSAFGLCLAWATLGIALRWALHGSSP
jgi:hypothetical protein